MPKDYFHASYSAECVSESDSLVDENIRLMPKDFMLLISLEVSV